MSDLEKGNILEALSSLPEKDKQFVLGYAAGRAADVKPEDSEPKEEESQEQ